MITRTGSPTVSTIRLQMGTQSVEQSAGLVQGSVSPSPAMSVETATTTVASSVVVSNKPAQRTGAISTAIRAGANRQRMEEIAKQKEFPSSVKRESSLVPLRSNRSHVRPYRSSRNRLESGSMISSGYSSHYLRSPQSFPTPEMTRTEGEDVTFTSQGTYN